MTQAEDCRWTSRPAEGGSPDMGTVHLVDQKNTERENPMDQSVANAADGQRCPGAGYVDGWPFATPKCPWNQPWGKSPSLCYSPGAPKDSWVP